MNVLVTGSCGLIGSEVSRYFLNLGWKVFGVDNDMRAEFFGANASTEAQRRKLALKIDYTHLVMDIRDPHLVTRAVCVSRPDLIVHTAAQPSHDMAAKIPFVDFEVNARGTLNLLEAARHNCPETPFVHMSTNKVYGDYPNFLLLVEGKKRFDFVFDERSGIGEALPIDQSTHSLFGCSKLAADIYVQEYGRYFGMPTCCLRGGCLTGPNHAGVELHGFLSYLIKCNVQQKEYTVHGYKGKQVRDNIHAYDVAAFIHEFQKAPRVGEVYNIGGGRGNSCSILEAFDLAVETTGIPMAYKIEDEARKGDHICYYSDLRKCKARYPNWGITKDLPTIFREIADAARA